MATTRNLWLILRARDEASRVVRSFGRNVADTASLMRAQSLRNQAVAKREEVNRMRALAAAQAVQISTQRSTAFAQRERAARLRAAGAATAQVTATLAHARSLEKEAKKLSLARNINVAHAASAVAAAEGLELEARQLEEAGREGTTFTRIIRNAGAALQQFGQVAMLTGAVVAGAGIAGVAFAKHMVNVAVEYERQVRRTLTQVDNMKVSLQDVGNIGRRVAQDIGVPFEKLQDTLFFIFSSIDVNLEEAEGLLKGFSKEAVAGQADIEAAARTSISIMNALQVPVSDLTRLQDVQFQVIRKGIISYEELSATIGRALPATARAGQSFETLGAMIAFMTRNGLSASMAATSAARALEAFAHPKTVERMEAMGVTVRDASGDFVPLVQIISQLVDRMKGMGEVARAKFMQELFLSSGSRIQARRFFDLVFSNFGEFDKMLGHMENSSGEFERAYNNMSASVATQSELLRNKWMLIKEALGSALLPVFLQFVTMLGKVLDWFNQLSPAVKDIIAKFLLWGSIAGIVIGGILVIVGALGFLVGGLLLAGKALFIMLGIVAALVVGLAAIGAAFILAWQNSEAFRDAVGSVIGVIKALWQISADFAMDVANSFREHLLPALQELWNTVESDVLPVVHDFANLWREELLPKIKEASEILKGIAETVFKFLADVIQNMVIPAVEFLTEKWREHEDKLRPIVAVVAQVVKWFIIIGGAILLIINPISILIVTFALVVGAIFLVVKAIELVWGWIQTLGSLIGSVFSTWLQMTIERLGQIRDFFVMIWQGIVSFLAMIWQAIVSVVMVGVGILRSIWQALWNTYGELIKAVWNLIVAIVMLGVTIVVEVIKTAVLGLKIFWTVTWTIISNFFRNIWNSITEFVSEKWDQITGLFNRGTRKAKSIWNAAWNAVKNFAADVWNAIVTSVIGRRISQIIRLISNGVAAVRRGWKIAWNAISNIVSDKWREVKDAVSSGIRTVRDFFSNAGTWLFRAGANIVQGLINGITSKVNALTDMINGISQKIKDFFPGSPVKTGPLKILNRGRAGAEIVKMIAEGIRKQAPLEIMRGLLSGVARELPAMRRQLSAAATEAMGFRPALGPEGIGRFESRQQPPEESKTVNQNITINTNEIDPEFHAARLGWLLEVQQ